MMGQLSRVKDNSPSQITFLSLWRQLGAPELIGKPLLWLSIILYLPSTIWIDSQKFSGPLYYWILLFLSAHTIFWLSLTCLDSFFHKKLTWVKPRPFINLMTIFLAGIIRFVFVVAVLKFTFFEIEYQWIMARLLAALGAALIIFIGGGLLSISKTEHERTVSLLNEAASDLEQQRQDVVLVLEKTEAQLMSTSQSILLPQLDEIRDLIVSSESRNYLIEHVRETIRTKVRPLSMELHQLAINIEPVEKRRERVSTNYSIMSHDINLYNSVWATPVFIVLISWIALGLRSIDQSWFIGQAILVWCAYPLIVWTFKFLIPKDLRVKPLRGFIVILLIHYVSSAPFIGVTLLNIPAQMGEPFVAITFFISAACLFTLTGASMVVSDQRRVEQSLSDVNAELNHQLRILDQKLWVARQNWSSLVHGPVQSALTVALFKLQNDDKEIDEEISKTLARVEKLIKKGPDRTTDLITGFESIRSTWDGVCRFQYKISDAAKDVLLGNQIASDCVLEIATELVGNAYRHGGARWITFNIDLNTNGDLNLYSQNDGSLKPKTDGSGLGAKMLDDLTLWWHLESKDTASITEFTALFPVQKYA
jgi:hypothetical protein